MTRARLSLAALVILLLLTVATWRLADTAAPAVLIAAVAGVKVLVILWVFLELNRSWPPWMFAGVAVTVVILGGATLAMG